MAYRIVTWSSNEIGFGHRSVW